MAKASLCTIFGCGAASEVFSQAFTSSSVTLHDPVRERDIPTLLWAPTSPGQYPLVLLNHGAGTGAAGYGYMAEALVAKGYVVAAFNECSSGCVQEDYMMDIAAVRDIMRNSEDYKGMLSGKAIAVGHSLGGGAQFVSADKDIVGNCNGHSPCNGGYTGDIDGIVGMAAGFIFSNDPVVPVPADTPDPFASAAKLDIPVLFLSGTHDCMVKSEDENYPAYTSMTESSCRVFANVDGADHCQFEKQGVLALLSCKAIEGLKGCSPSMSPDSQQALSVKYATLFADYVTKGDAAALQSLLHELGSDDGIASFEHQGCSEETLI
jgi:pimeloyl-ACP methyl ester carboxylesterase